MGWSNNLSSDSRGKKNSMRGIEERLLRGQSWPQTRVILELMFSKNILLNGLANPLGIEKLEL